MFKLSFLYPLDGPKIKRLRGCKKDMLSKESGREPTGSNTNELFYWVFKWSRKYILC